ncbi:MAG: transcription termination/antitermination protein NusA [Candidatus Krumholzibacteriota bacterium]|nr:transcription termination/antitermination protein NusA [Candidatus Krumholzibacteriota bacterium]
MNTGFIDAFAQIIREKRVDKNTLVETIKMSLASAARRKLGQEAEIQVHLDEQKGVLEVFRIWKVVEEVEDDVLELSLEDAREIDEEAAIGGEVAEELPIVEFGRNAVQTAKQVLTQRVREAERERIYDEYKDKVGVIVVGTVRQVDRGNILVNLGRAEAYLPLREQIRKERYNQGETIRACIIEVDKEARGPQIIISRTSELFLRKLFEQEVPEIFDGDVEIRSIAREPGGRSKIAVFSRSDKVDAVGSCVGMKGSRVQAVVNELHGEKIDIVPWNENQHEYVSRALAPAKVSSLRFNESESIVLAIVDDDQLSLAIGREGQNVRLASRLTGWKIDLTTVRETERRDRLEQKLQMDISEMYGVTPRLSGKLKNCGILTVQKLYKTPIEEILGIEGIGPKTAEKLKATAAETNEELNRALEELLVKEKEEEAAKKQLFDDEVFADDEEAKEEAKLTEEQLFGNLGDDDDEEDEGEDEDAASGEAEEGGEDDDETGGASENEDDDGPSDGEEAVEPDDTHIESAEASDDDAVMRSAPDEGEETPAPADEEPHGEDKVD